MAHQAYSRGARGAYTPQALRGLPGLRGLPVSGWLRLAVIACAALAVALALLAHALAPTPNQSRALIGHPAPSFTLPATQGGQTLAQPVTFTGHSAHPTLLVFFNTLCVHCAAGVQAAQRRRMRRGARRLMSSTSMPPARTLRSRAVHGAAAN